MDEIIIGGGRRLCGEVQVSGAKNAALPILFATLLTPEVSRVTNVPDVADCRTTARLLAKLGAEVSVEGDTVTVAAARIEECEANYDLVKTMRASFLAMGPLLARFGHARVATPGGCAIGSRPIDQHLRGFAALGAEITMSEGYVEARCERLQGAEIRLEVPSVGATENLMMAATLAAGTTILDNVAREPEIVDLAVALQSMGAEIEGAGGATITIRGRESLAAMRHTVIPDRIEAGTWLATALATGGEVLVKGAREQHLGAFLDKLREMGACLEVFGDSIRASVQGPLRPVDAVTAPYPGFPTDLQAQLMALLCLVEGESRIRETIFENRFMHAQELGRLGAEIVIDGGAATIHGGRPLSGADVMATDLRASVSLIIAALGASGRTRLQRVYHLDRGYERLEAKLRALGADVERVDGRVSEGRKLAQAATAGATRAASIAVRPADLLPAARSASRSRGE
ncbi:MAG: UDP-N-acetylglucosamine 1-carboxyvinyltransferase [Deltaproteobacteria bacterium]